LPSIEQKKHHIYYRGDANINQHVCKALIVEKYENNEGGIILKGGNSELTTNITLRKKRHLFCFNIFQKFSPFYGQQVFFLCITGFTARY
jgi:hypothetical protein